jgi:hypothetical protein
LLIAGFRSEFGGRSACAFFSAAKDSGAIAVWGRIKLNAHLLREAWGQPDLPRWRSIF